MKEVVTAKSAKNGDKPSNTCSRVGTARERVCETLVLTNIPPFGATGNGGKKLKRHQNDSNFQDTGVFERALSYYKSLKFEITLTSKFIKKKVQKKSKKKSKKSKRHVTKIVQKK
jgi:hypothetical protein